MRSRNSDIPEFLKGVIGIVEANSYEHMCLWKEYHDRKSWKEGLAGYGEVVGYLGEHSINIALNVDEIDGYRVLFWYPTSRVVDYEKIYQWMNDNLPVTAFRDNDPRQGIVEVDAMNFHNVFPMR